MTKETIIIDVNGKKTAQIITEKGIPVLPSKQLDLTTLSEENRLIVEAAIQLIKENVK
jgi:hypothetical protein